MSHILARHLFYSIKQSCFRIPHILFPVPTQVTLPDEPISYSWCGGALLSRDPDFYSLCVTREEYDEEGKALAYERFDI